MSPAEQLAAQITPKARARTSQQLELERLVTQEVTKLHRKQARLEQQLRATEIEIARITKVFGGAPKVSRP
jgi:hypothetical protein